MRQIAKVSGHIATAEVINPFQTKLSLIITDFEPNGNKVGIPVEEKQNVIASALFSPLKVNFDGVSYSGHAGAFPVGPITSVYETQYNGRDVIAGDAIIWTEHYSEIAEYLKSIFDEGIGTSWEIYYDTAEQVDGINWLKGCVFAGTCIVETPAYGPTRTKILAIAELLDKEVKQSVAETEVETLREELTTTQDLIWKIWEGLDSLYSKTFDIQAQNAERDLSKVASEFNDRIQALVDKFTSLKTSIAELETVKTERDTLLQEKAELARQAKLSEVTNKLKDAGLDNVSEDMLKTYSEMSEEAFTVVLNSLSAVKGRKEVSEQTNKKTVPPEPEIKDTGTGLSNSEIAAAFNKK